MQDTEKEFVNDLFEAKLKYVTTRPYLERAPGEAEAVLAEYHRTPNPLRP